MTERLWSPKTDGNLRIWPGETRSDGRAISTVADVSLALLLIIASITMLGGLLNFEQSQYDRKQGSQTAETVGAVTINATYSVESVLENAPAMPGETDEYDDAQLQRVSHGPVAGQVAAGAIANIRFDAHSEPSQLSIAATEYERALDEALQASLVESSFRTNVSGHWEPFDNASIQGGMAVGQQPPPDASLSLRTVTVSSGIHSARQEAIAKVSDEQSFDVVARVVAGAIVEGLLPVSESQRALESTGLERELTVYRYRRLANLTQGIEPGAGALAVHLERERANASAANEYLLNALAAQLETELESSFDTAYQAASAVSTGKLTISVRTWNR